MSLSHYRLTHSTGAPAQSTIGKARFVALVALCISNTAPGATLYTLPVPAGYEGLNTQGLSEDGSTFVGSAYNFTDNYSSAFRWTKNEGIELLATPAGFPSSYANSVSGDGTVITGGSQNNSTGASGPAWVWNRAGGTMPVNRRAILTRQTG